MTIFWGIVIGALLPVVLATIDAALGRWRRRKIERRRLLFGDVERMQAFARAKAWPVGSDG